MQCRINTEALSLSPCVCVCVFFFFFLRLDPLVLTKVLGSAPENNNHRSPLRTIFVISISAAVHRPKIGWQSGDIFGSSDHRPMIGRLVADGKSWMYILRNYASILQMYTKQVTLCNFINVIIVMKTSLIRQPFFYKKNWFFFLLLYMMSEFYLIFFPLLPYRNTIQHWHPMSRRGSTGFKLKLSSKIGRLFVDHRATIAWCFTDEKVMKKEGSFNETFNLVVSTKKSSADQSLIQNRWKHRPTIDRQSPENPTPHFCSPKIGRLSAWVNVNNRIINHVKCTVICS